MFSVLKGSVPKTLTFALGPRLRSKTQRSKTRVLGRRLPNGKPPKGLLFRDMRSKTLAFEKRIAIMSCVYRFPSGPGLAFRSFAFKKHAVSRLCSHAHSKSMW